MLKKGCLGILLLIVLLVVGLLVWASTKPDEFRFERSKVINAPAEKVFVEINDFRNWGAWSPWEKLDPNMKRTHSGAASGKGAKYAWVGNDQVGEGTMEILESIPHSKITIRLDFVKPFAASNTAEFTLTKEGNGTKVMWAMFGKNVFMSKVFSVIMDMDKAVGAQFEEGLTSLQKIAEKP